MSRTKDTELQYYDRGISLLKRAYKEAREEGHDFTDNSIKIKVKNESVIIMEVMYASIWASKKWSHKYRPNTWAQYRCSIRFVAKLFLKKNKIDKETFDKTCLILEKTKGGDKKNLEPQTSSHKKKSFNPKEIKALEDFINQENKNYRWGKATLFWIKASILVGLRPIEWRNSTYLKKENILIVLNAKNTNGRAIGEFRNLSLNHLNDNQIETVCKHLDFAKRMSDNDKWEIYYQGCSNFIKYATRRIWPHKERLPSLYSGRHQFSANMKASGCRRNEVAALMGHSSDETAAEHYGKKIFGTRSKKPEVNVNDLSKVRVVEPYKFSFKNNPKNKN
jgi:integrase